MGDGGKQRTRIRALGSITSALPSSFMLLSIRASRFSSDKVHAKLGSVEYRCARAFNALAGRMRSRLLSDTENLTKRLGVHSSLAKDLARIPIGYAMDANDLVSTMKVLREDVLIFVLVSDTIEDTKLALKSFAGTPSLIKTAALMKFTRLHWETLDARLKTWTEKRL